MSDNTLIYEVSKSFAKSKTNLMFAVPDGKFIGDLFVITDSHHKIIFALMWDGTRWVHEYEVFDVQKP